MNKVLNTLVMLTCLAFTDTALSQTPVTPERRGKWTKPNVSYGEIRERISVGKVLLFPTGCGAPDSLYATDLGQAAIYFDSCGAVLYRYDPKSHAWGLVGGGGSVLPYNGDTSFYLAGDSTLHEFALLTVHDTCCGVSHIVNDTLFIVSGSDALDTTSLSDRINLKVNIGDTAAMLNPYLRKVDTASMLLHYLRSNSAAGGDLSGAYPSPGVAKFDGQLPAFYLSRSNHTGTQTASTISDFTSTVQTIGDARYAVLSGSYSNPSWLTGLAWSKISSTPTTLSGYGITDAAPLTFKTSLDALTGIIKGTAGTYSAITDNSSNWNTAFGWGNHASAGYELQSNKATTLSTVNHTLYPTVQAVVDYINDLNPILAILGTTNRITTSVVGNVVTLNISSSYVGQSSITTVGALTSGAVPYSLLTGTVPTWNQNTTGSAAKWTTARTLAGNSVDGSANVPFPNKFIVQGTTDAGLTGAQFLGALGTGLVKNTTSTGVLSIASAGTDYEAAQTGTGYVKSAAGTKSYVTSIPNADLTNSTIIIDGVSTALGSSIDTRPAIIELGSNQTSTSISMAGVTGLSIAVTAGKRYRLSGTILSSCDNTGGIKLGLSVTGTPVLKGGSILGNIGATNANRLAEIAALDGTNQGLFNTVVASAVEEINCTFVAGSAGTAQLTFAAQTAGQTATIRAGTTLILTQTQ